MRSYILDTCNYFLHIQPTNSIGAIMNLSDPIYHNADKAREHLEALLWPNGAVCPHCGSTDKGSKIKGGRAGLYFCNACREQYTVTVGTVFERSKIPLNKWVLATHLMSASKTGISAHQLHRMLGITYKSAWFMCHRVREAMKSSDTSPMGGPDTEVQADETYQGNSSHRAKGYTRHMGKKQQVVALVEPSTGRVRAFHVGKAKVDKVREILFNNIQHTSILVTDESPLYEHTGKAFGDHQTVKHSGKQYVNKEGFHTNNVENFLAYLNAHSRPTS